jgi:hypothetical protein
MTDKEMEQEYRWDWTPELQFPTHHPQWLSRLTFSLLLSANASLKLAAWVSEVKKGTHIEVCGHRCVCACVALWGISQGTFAGENPIS